MDEKLKEIFANINDWLKYAEAKSATLIAGNGALIWGLVRVSKTFELNYLLSVTLLISISLCVASLVVCLISIVPSLSMPWEVKPSGKTDSDNLLYFADIAKYSPTAYLSALEAKLGLEPSDHSGYQKDISSQIITNAVIANAKYKNFQIAAWITLSSLITPLGTLAIFIIRKK
jgi:hypothetical protein